MDDIKAECIFNEQLEQAVHVKEEEDIKEEREWEWGAAWGGVSAAAARAGLYANHEVKDELVLGPAGVQPQDVAFTLYACQASAARAQPAPRDCDVSADARRPEGHVANTADVGNQAHSYANIHTEKEPFVCDIYNKWFTLKTQLVEHVMIHMHQEPEQEQIRVADNARAANARQHPALRDCVVTLERLVALGAGRDERRATRAGRDTDIQKELHGNSDVSTEEETYICDTCKKRFPRKSQLVEHVESHSQRRESRRGAGSTCQASAARAQPAPRDCDVSADARRPEGHVANTADVGNQAHSYADIHTEKEPYVCDICKKRFALKTQLMEHVMIHIHQEPEQEEIRVADNVAAARAANARPHPALRDCVVTFERLVALGAGRDERLATRAGRDTDIQKELHGNSDVNTEEETYICDTCKKWFPRKSQLVEHVVSHSQRRESRRGAGSVAAARAPNARQHPALRDCVVTLERLVALGAGRDERLATRAGRDTDIQKEIHGISDVSTEEATYICDTCKKRFPRKSQLVEHVVSHSQRRESRRGAGSARGGRGEGREPTREDCRHACPTCYKAFPTPSKLKRHQLTHTGERPFSCGICQQKFTHLSSLKSHEIIHTGEKPFSCGICKQKFAQLGTLKRHELTHTGERRYSCGICKQKFTQSSHLKRHELIHTGLKPFSCGICQQKFTQLSNLKRHELTHTGERLYSCGICKQKFTQLTHLKSHERIHTGGFACVMCKKQFTELRHLKNHKDRIHADGKPFCCDICQKRFAQKTTLDRHIRRHRTATPR